MTTNHAERAAELADEAFATANAGGDKPTAAIGATLAVAHAVLALVDVVRDATRKPVTYVEGGVVASPTVVAGEIAFAGRQPQRSLEEYRLTPKETEVARCLLAGMSKRAISQRLFMSENTARTHVANILAKTHSSSALAAVAVLRRAGLTEAEAAR